MSVVDNRFFSRRSLPIEIIATDIILNIVTRLAESPVMEVSPAAIPTSWWPA